MRIGPTDDERRIGREVEGYQQTLRDGLASGLVWCPKCGGSGESEHWTTCDLCDGWLLCSAEAAQAECRDELARALALCELYHCDYQEAK